MSNSFFHSSKLFPLKSTGLDISSVNTCLCIIKVLCVFVNNTKRPKCVFYFTVAIHTLLTNPLGLQGLWDLEMHCCCAARGIFTFVVSDFVLRTRLRTLVKEWKISTSSSYRCPHVYIGPTLHEKLLSE